MTTDPTPARFRHRSEEVEAIQWTGTNAEALRAFCGPDFDEIDLDDRQDPDETAAVREGKHGTWRGITPGYWVVRLDGGLYEFSAADFAERYEPVPVSSAVPDHTLRDRVAEAPVKQRADCTELEWAVQERARFERLYTRETVRADLAEQRADTAARDTDIYQRRLERLGEGYTRERKRAERAEAEAERLRTYRDATCICGHTEAQHFEDACLVCDCGDYLAPEAAREVIDRYQEAVKRGTADRADILCEAADDLAELIAMHGPTSRTVAGWRGAIGFLRRLAAEAQPEPEAWDVPDARPGTTDHTLTQAAAGVRQPDTETAASPFTPPAHYRGRDGTEYCVHAIPVGPDSCQECRDLHQPAAPAATGASDVLAKVVAALQAKAAELSTEAEQEMRRDLEDQAQVWHEAAEVARRVGRKAARSAQPAAGDSGEERIVAYRSPLPGAWSLYCTRHGDELGDARVPLASDDLPDGGLCAKCGVDVLIPQAPQ